MVEIQLLLPFSILQACLIQIQFNCLREHTLLKILSFIMTIRRLLTQLMILYWLQYLIQIQNLHRMFPHLLYLTLPLHNSRRFRCRLKLYVIPKLPIQILDLFSSRLQRRISGTRYFLATSVLKITLYIQVRIMPYNIL